MWIVNDFLVYEMLSSQMTVGKLSCPCCLELSNAFNLKHSRKVSNFDCHCQFHPTNHPYRSNRNSLTKNRIKKSTPLLRLMGEQLWRRVWEFDKTIVDLMGMGFPIITPSKAFSRSYLIGPLILSIITQMSCILRRMPLTMCFAQSWTFLDELKAH